MIYLIQNVLYAIIFRMIINLNANEYEVLFVLVCSICFEKQLITINECCYALSLNELLIIDVLANNDNVFTHSEILEKCWPGKIVSQGSLPVAIKHIRDIFKKHTHEDVVITHKGKGYSIDSSLIKVTSITRKQEKREEKREEKRGVFLFLFLFLFLSIIFFIEDFGITYTKRNGSLIYSDFAIPPKISVDSGKLFFISHLGIKIVCNENGSCVYDKIN